MGEQKSFYSEFFRKIQVNVPFKQLQNRYLGSFMNYEANPEIGIDAEVIDTASAFELRKIARAFHENKRRITLHAPFMDIVPGGIDRKILSASRERLARFFEIIPIFQPFTVVCHTGYNPVCYREHWKAWLRNSIATWKPLVRSAERLGIKLLLENVYEETPDVHLALFDAIQSDYLGLCFDIGHHNVFSKVNLNNWMDSLGEKLMEVHLHDNMGEMDTHSAIGKGNIDFGKLFNILNQKALKPVLTLEPHKEDTLWQSLASLQLLWPPDR